MVMTGAQGQNDTPAGAIYELRVYHTCDGKLPDLMARFRDHTIDLFKNHGMKDLTYWIPTDEPLTRRTLVYVLEHASRLAAAESWANLIADPQWVQAAEALEASGKFSRSPHPPTVAGERTGKFRLGTKELVVDAEGNSKISFADYAIAMVDEIETPKHEHTSFSVGY